jgi:WD40 repeat protein
MATLAWRDRDDFDAAQYTFIGGFQVGTGTERATFSPDGQTLVVATSSGVVESVDVATRTDRGQVPSEGSVDVIAFSPDGTRLVTAENLHGREYLVPRDPVTLGSISPKRLTPGDQVRSGDVRRFPFFSMAFTPDSRSLITTSFSGPTVLWNAAGLTEVHRFEIPGGGVAVSPDGTTAAIIVNHDQSFEGDVSFLTFERTRCERNGRHHGPFKTQEGPGSRSPGWRMVTVNDSRP